MKDNDNGVTMSMGRSVENVLHRKHDEVEKKKIIQLKKRPTKKGNSNDAKRYHEEYKKFTSSTSHHITLQSFHYFVDMSVSTFT